MGTKSRAGWALALALAALLALPFSCAGPAAPGGPDDGQSGELAAQETRVAVLQGQNNALRTAVARSGSAPTPTPVAPVAALPAPLPTLLPTPLGLAVAGAGKGQATARVTITEYTDYL